MWAKERWTLPAESGQQAATKRSDSLMLPLADFWPYLAWCIFRKSLAKAGIEPARRLRDTGF